MKKRFTFTKGFQGVLSERPVIELEEEGIIQESDAKEKYVFGPAADRFKAYEDLGYSPEELKKIIEKNKYYRILANYQYGAYGTCSSRYELFKKAGDEERKKCDDIKSMYPSTLFTEAGFEYYYQKDEGFRKLVDERIARAILDKKSPIYISTRWSVNDPFKMKLEEYAEMLKKGYGHGLHHPYLKDIDEMHNRPWGWGVPGIDKVKFNNPATIVFWMDGTKTVVKAQNGEPYDPEKGLAMAISKRALGNDRAYYDEFSKQLGKGQKHSTPEQFNSEVCDIKKYDALWEKCGDELRCSTHAFNILRSVVNDKKATKAQILDAIVEACAFLGPVKNFAHDNEKETK